MKHIFHLVFLVSAFFSKLNGQNSICQPYIFKNVEPSFIHHSNGNMFFVINGTDAGLWRSDGTLQGTVKINTAPPSVFIEFFRAFDGFTYFTTLSPVQLWKTDGTDAGTSMVKEIPNANRIYELTAANNQLFFLVEGSNYVNKLWKTDGTTNGTNLVLDIDPSNSISWDPIRMCALNEFVFFNAGTQTNGVEIWKSDGTAAGTQIVKEIGPGFQDGTSHLVNSFMGELNGKVYFYGGLTNSGQKGLWQTDGTEQGTNFVKAIGSISKSYHIGNLLYFLASDVEAINGGSLYGEELWVTDGTASGTYMVKDIRQGSSWSSTTNFSIKDIGSNILFYANDGISGSEPWISDGTPEGTHLLKDINPGSISSANGFYSTDVLNGFIYFLADNGVNGRELWATDGTSAGTNLVADIIPGSEGSSPYDFNVYNGNLFFSAQPPGSFYKSIWSCGNFIGINDVFKQTIEIYPNPSSGILHISNIPQGSRIKLLNKLGQVLVNMDSEDAQTSLDVSRFANGLYTIMLESDGGMVTRKVLIEK